MYTLPMLQRLSTNQAAVIGLEALAFLLRVPDRTGQFIDQTGTLAGEFRARAGEPDFLASVLDFFLTNEELLTGFCSASATDVRAVHMARHVLGGG